jgi:hypothetical protein
VPETPEDQYGIFDESTAPSVPQPPPRPTPAAAAPPARPRRADGTFAPAHSPQVLDRARRLGISDETIARSSPEELNDLSWSLVQAQQARALEERQQLFSSMRGNPAIPSEPASPETPAATVASTDDLDLPQRLADNLDSDFLRLIRGLTSRVKALETRLGQLHGTVQAQAESTVTDHCDRAFAKYPQIYGSARRSELTEDSVFFKRRMATASNMKGLKNIADVEPAIDRITKELFGGPSPPAPAARAPGRGQGAASPLTPEQEEWNAAVTARPTGFRGSEEPKGLRRAAQAVARWQRDNAAANGILEPTDEEEPGIPE